MDSLVSIAIPLYNTARFLPAALDSLLAQDHPRWECLLWDDGSTDGGSEIAAGYAHRDPRIRLLGNGRNNGVGVAVASALELAAGDYLCVLDSDDELEPNALSRMLAFMRANPHLGMAYSQYVEIDEGGTVLRPGKHYLPPYSAQNLLVNFMTYQFRTTARDLTAARFDRIDTGLALFNVPPCVLAWGWKEKPTAAREAAEAAERDLDVSTQRNPGAVKSAQRTNRHEPGTGDGRAGMAGQSDGIGKAVFDQSPFCCAEQFGQRVTQRDGGNPREEFGKGHFDLLQLPAWATAGGVTLIPVRRAESARPCNHRGRSQRRSRCCRP